MKKVTSIILALILALGALSVCSVSAAQDTPVSFETYEALYAHAVTGSTDSEAWQAWQSEHDEDFMEVNSNVKYFFLPTSADSTKVDIYNAYKSSVNVNGVDIASGEIKTVDYDVNSSCSVKMSDKTYTLKFMKSNAEAAIYINNSNADGYGTELMKYLNADKSRSAKATGAIVDAKGNVDNTAIKKIKGRGNTTWDKPKKAYNITYSDSVSIAGMKKGKKYSILANYQDDSLSRNRFLYDLADAVGMPYASDSRYVDFYANGFYWGSYQMTEKVESGSSNLVSDVDDTAYLNDDGTVNSDFPFICEVDAGAKDGEDYYVESASGNKITIKAPELEEGDAGYEEVKAYVKEKFDAFYNSVKGKTSDPTDYADVESLAKIYLINELGKNWDSGVSSLYFVYKQDSSGKYKFYGSPVWDYDNSLGNAVGVEWELNNIGVSDYEEYSGWWCKYKGKSTNSRSINNVMNLISRNNKVYEKSVSVWFEDFVPVINDFASDRSTPKASSATEMYRAYDYYALLKDSAEMNYQSGWLLNTSSWIADHSSLTKAHYDITTKTYTVDSKATTYTQDFTGMYNYCIDWMTSRAAWLSSEMADDYTPAEKLLGDVNKDGKLSITDATDIQKYAVGSIYFTPSKVSCGDVNGDGAINVLDATEIQKMIVK
ncbi:CotH kinase family protein [uncultured Ruminococcus sp.]|uniref:CotH kinase family protein n=1 Tax=uncultured Ruminococcus sp. TaxID=165186 RepID=UPI0025F6C989|nr:CotH kinase family protein [uncultured Ruminococcus sp.]